jgi:Arc/MetJ family transcription regulator
MSRVSVEVPAELVKPIRETMLLLYEATAESLHLALRARALDEVRLHRRRLEELDELVRALEPDEQATELSATRDIVHDALYGALIDAGERLAEASNQAWRGELPLERVQAAAEEVLAVDALLRGLGAG